jgi:hypothetical protein
VTRRETVLLKNADIFKTKAAAAVAVGSAPLSVTFGRWSEPDGLQGPYDYYGRDWRSTLACP